MTPRLPSNATDPEEVIHFFESTGFNEDTKVLGAKLMRRMNRLLHRYVNECRASGVTKEVCFDSQKLALATCLKMRTADSD